MLTYTVRRVFGTIPVLLLITLLVFGLLQLAPGDPADILLPEEATHEDIAEARARWGLDRPFHEQYLNFLISAVQGDFGESFRFKESVIVLLGQRFPATLELAFFACLFAILIGVPLGVWAGARPNSWVDNLGSVFGSMSWEKIIGRTAPLGLPSSPLPGCLKPPSRSLRRYCVENRVL